jgi:hypothetical protein
MAGQPELTEGASNSMTSPRPIFKTVRHTLDAGSSRPSINAKYFWRPPNQRRPDGRNGTKSLQRAGESANASQHRGGTQLPTPRLIQFAPASSQASLARITLYVSFYYRFVGRIACLALLINIVLLIVRSNSSRRRRSDSARHRRHHLTIGLAVDASVLI